MTRDNVAVDVREESKLGMKAYKLTRCWCLVSRYAYLAVILT